MYCPKCGAQTGDKAVYCAACGENVQQSQNYAAPQYPSTPSIDDDAVVRAMLPVGQTGLSILAGYLGLFSLLISILGPFAIVVSILALREFKRDPRKHGAYRAWIGLITGIIGSIFLIVLIIVIAGSSMNSRTMP